MFLLVLGVFIIIPDNGIGNGSFVSGPSGHIPKSAKNIEWYSPAFGPMNIVKFNIDEARFREWAIAWKERESDLSEIIKGGVQIFLYDHIEKKTKRLDFESIYFMSYQKEDRSLTIAYDNKTETAYYNYLSR